MAFALLAAATPGSSLAIRDAVALLPASPWRDATLGLADRGLRAEGRARAAARLAAAGVPGGADPGLGRAQRRDHQGGRDRTAPLPAPRRRAAGLGRGLAAVGLLSAFYGVAIGITQTNPKTVLAYSSVSQMGFVAAVLGMALAAGDGAAAMAAAFYAAHHVLAKGALFLAVGVVAATGARRFWPVLLPAAVLALGFGGLPLTGGYLAKLAVKDPLGGGMVGLLATLAGAGSALLMLHFLAASAPLRARPAATAPAGLVAAVAGDGLRRRRGPLGALFQRRHRQPGGGTRAGSALGRPLAGAARRRARRPAAPLRRPSAAGARGRHRGDRRACRARRLRPGASRWRAPRASCSAGPSPVSPCSRSCSSWA